jgi:hypothetical protein
VTYKKPRPIVGEAKNFQVTVHAQRHRLAALSPAARMPRGLVSLSLVLDYALMLILGCADVWILAVHS